MDDPLIAEAAEQQYADSLGWYAERSKRAAEGFEAEFQRALEAINDTTHRPLNPLFYPTG